MPQIKMVVLDFDGVIVECGKGEKLWRWLAKKMKIRTPKIFLFLQEITEFILNKKSQVIIKTEMVESIKKLKKNHCLVGLLTDRSLWSLHRIIFFENNLPFEFSDFDFIQTRENILDLFIKPFLFTLPINIKFKKSKKIKPDICVFKNLKSFIAENNIEVNETVIVDDLSTIIELARVQGFLTIHFF
ncbi:MAG: hypothetical protein HYW71_01200 [Candidatus Niyogibacteria bacterium]|nr:hypothetical protein [Candidatus Niyogibacteria bacterium]